MKTSRLDVPCRPNGVFVTFFSHALECGAILHSGCELDPFDKMVK